MNKSKKFHIEIHYALLCSLLFISIPAIGKLEVSEAVKLPQITESSMIVDSLWLADKNLLLISMHGSPPEVLIYNVDFENKTLTLDSRQNFAGFAPVFLRNRDFIFAFTYKAPSLGAKAVLYALNDDVRFRPLYTFEQDIKNVAATLQSNFVATIDYAVAQQKNILVTPRLKLFNTTKDGTTGALVRRGKAIGVINMNELMSLVPNMRSQAIGKINALAMSPLARSQNGDAYNRVIALSHTAGTKHNVHIWYFPSFENDFNNGQGHMIMPVNREINNLVFSPRTFGRILAINKLSGKIMVMQFDLSKKLLKQAVVLDTEKPKPGHATQIAAQFDEIDSVIAGLNESLFLFEKGQQGYGKADIQPADLKLGEFISKIEVSGNRFIVIGTQGSVQFGTTR